MKPGSVLVCKGKSLSPVTQGQRTELSYEAMSRLRRCSRPFRNSYNRELVKHSLNTHSIVIVVIWLSIWLNNIFWYMYGNHYSRSAEKGDVKKAVDCVWGYIFSLSFALLLASLYIRDDSKGQYLKPSYHLTCFFL